jgi:hypothetical protein
VIAFLSIVDCERRGAFAGFPRTAAEFQSEFFCHELPAALFLYALLSRTTVLMSANDTPTDRPSFQDPIAYVRSATFSRGESSTQPLDNAVTASDLLLGAYDPAKLHPLADLGDKLDYLSLEDDKTTDMPGAGSAIPSRGWSDDLCYGTGTMYLSGKWRSR